MSKKLNIYLAGPRGLKRLMARPVAKYTIVAQEKHEKNEKVHADE